MLTLRRNTTEYSYAVAALTALVADGWYIHEAIDGEDNALNGATIDEYVKWTATCEQGFIRIGRSFGDADAMGRTPTNSYRFATLSLVWQGSNNDPECVIADYSACNDATLRWVSDVLDEVTDSLDLPL